MAVDVVHTSWSGEVGSQLDNRRIHVRAFCHSNTMRGVGESTLWAMDSSHISASGSHSVLESSLENEDERRFGRVANAKSALKSVHCLLNAFTRNSTTTKLLVR